MKPTPGSAKTRRTTAKVAAKKPGEVRLNLKRAPKPPEPEQILEKKQKSHFWRWVAFVTLLHVLVITGASLWLAMATQIKQPEQFISLLPQGDVVKGTPGEQKAPKVGTTAAAHVAHHAAQPPAPTTPPAPKAVEKTVTPPKPVVKPLPKPDAPSLEKAVVKPPPIKPKPTPPKPKVKVDLNLADGPTPPADKPKPKLHAKKPTLRPDNETDKQDSDAESTGLSRDEVAAKLGKKADAAGVKNATQIGRSGSTNGHPNDFSDFYALVRDQVMNAWVNPNLAQQPDVNPSVEIYVEKDGAVPADRVRLVRSSGNSVYDDSAVSAAKSLGHLHEPLPNGCPPLMTINFTLTP